eukprot:6677676-Pyramimonas_sp.AAC.1
MSSLVPSTPCPSANILCTDMRALHFPRQHYASSTLPPSSRAGPPTEVGSAGNIYSPRRKG